MCVEILLCTAIFTLSIFLFDCMRDIKKLTRREAANEKMTDKLRAYIEENKEMVLHLRQQSKKCFIEVDRLNCRISELNEKIKPQ